MGLHDSFHAQYPASQDGFVTMTEMGQWLLEHRLVGAEPNEPFLLITRRISQRASCHFTHGTNEDYLETRAYLGVISEDAPFARVAGPALLIGARRYVPFAERIVELEHGFQVQLGDFCRTPIKEPFMPLTTVGMARGFAPGEVTQALMFDVGIEAIENRILAECEHAFGLIPWYAKASYRLDLAPLTGAMRAAVDQQKQLVLDQLRAALLGRLDVDKYVKEARALGLEREGGVIEIERGVFFSLTALSDRTPNPRRTAA